MTERITRADMPQVPGGNGMGTAPTGPASVSSPALAKYVDPLPIPPVVPANLIDFPGAAYYEMSIRQRSWQFHRDLGVARTWGYWAVNPLDRRYPVGMGYLGPTIDAHSQRPVVVRFVNQLPTSHLLRESVDVTLWENLPGVAPDPPGGRSPNTFPEFPPGNVWCTTHLHGGFVPAQFSGHPLSWFTPDGEHGPKYASWHRPRTNEAVYVYPNTQPAATLWYHDNAMAVSRLNVYAGLAGLYLVRDGIEDLLGLPRRAFEVPLLIQDRTFRPDGSLSYPAVGTSDRHPRWVPEFLGDTPVVNGRAYPFLDVEPRRYRLRVVNGSNARWYDLSFDDGSGRLPFWLIAGDQGLVTQPVRMTMMLLAPGERADVIVDFTEVAGGQVRLANSAPAPYPGGGGPELPEIMLFRVGRERSEPERSTAPDRLAPPPIPPLVAAPGVRVRDVVLGEDADPVTGDTLHALLNQRWFFEPVEEEPRAGTTEVWQFANLTAAALPVHLDLVRFQVLDRRVLDVPRYTAACLRWAAAGRNRATRPRVGDYVRGAPVPPAPEEAGWKDTVKTYGGMVTRVIATFDVPHAVFGHPATGTRLPAEYTYRCSTLERQDNEMMRPFRVVDPSS
ncbi:multicopper oxidase family protein [Gandjariella thermophila]|uniref:Spore coat protein A n=1 Tax=Gandjariella thermophila TaxID=1931992 RepID=A0A4D4J9T2_9PSEU|nr:multicopper oxidase domain-containing protein [Gandjariella thermophila]GDY31428.1 spore coat protein A [Gandjariella thermophila]